MKRIVVSLVAAVAFAALPGLSLAQDVRVEIPITLKNANVVMFVDTMEMTGNVPGGLAALSDIAESFRDEGVKGKIVAVFDDNGTYLLLRDEAYAATIGGANPYRGMIADLQRAGVEFAVCANDMKEKGIGNAQLLEGVKPATRGILLVLELVQKGYTLLPPAPASSGGQD